MADPNSDPEEPRGGLADALRRYIDAITGFADLSRERAERVVGDLATRGEGRAKDLEKSARDLYERSAQNREELVRLVQKEIRRQVDSLNEEVDRLQRRVRDLEARRPSDRPDDEETESTT